MRISDYNCKYFSNSHALNAFLADVRKYKVPTVAEEEHLVREYRENGNIKAKEELLLRNLRFIYSLAKIYSRNEDEVVDYVNEGVIGFYEALDKYDMLFENRFTTFAVWYIRRGMNYYLNNTRNLINRSNNGKLSKKIEAVKSRHFVENGREPSVDEIKELISEHYGIEVKEDCDVFDVSIASINDELDDDYTVENSDEFSVRTAEVNDYERTIELDATKARVASILSLLPEKYCDIVKMIYGIGYDREYTTQEIARKYDIRAFNVMKIRDKAIKYLQQSVDSVKMAL